jgi:hypothetical protein
MKIVLITLIFISTIFYSCKTNEPETIDLNDIVAQTKGDKLNTDSITKTIASVAITGLNNQNLLLNNIIIKAPRNQDTVLFLDRFSSKFQCAFFIH